MTVAEKVVVFLREHRGNAYCDDCLKEHLRFSQRQQANRVTNALALSSDYRRDIVTCQTCGKDKKSTAFA